MAMTDAPGTASRVLLETMRDAGVKYLFVNGKPVIDGGEFKDVLAGKALRHKAE